MSDPTTSQSIRMSAELAEAIVIARHRGYATYSDAEVHRLLKRVSNAFPGMEIQCVRPFNEDTRPLGERRAEYTIVVFRWSRVRLLETGIVLPEHLPVAPKRHAWLGSGSNSRSVKLASCGDLIVRADIADDLEPRHPLAMFSPLAIRSGATPSQRTKTFSYLRLAIDNTKGGSIHG